MAHLALGIDINNPIRLVCEVGSVLIKFIHYQGGTARLYFDVPPNVLVQRYRHFRGASEATPVSLALAGKLGPRGKDERHDRQKAYQPGDERGDELAAGGEGFRTSFVDEISILAREARYEPELLPLITRPAF